MNRWLLAAALAAAFYGWGRWDGNRLCEARHTAFALAAEKAKAAALSDLAAAEQRNRLMALELEDAARAEPVQSPACLSVDRVRRLNLR